LTDAAERMARLLGDILEQNKKLQDDSARLRTSILADLRPLIDATPAQDRGAILSNLVVRVQSALSPTESLVKRPTAPGRASEASSVEGVLT
jgi:hypothetical protein